MSGQLGALLVLAALGVGSAVAVAAARASVPRASHLARNVHAVLPGANCGACGHSSCFAAAEDIAAGRAPADTCRTGGPDVTAAVDSVMAGSAVPRTTSPVDTPPPRTPHQRGPGGVGDGAETDRETARSA